MVWLPMLAVAGTGEASNATAIRGGGLNPSTAQAEVIVDELVRNGVWHAVLSPGSRNAALAFALHRAARDERLRLHVRIDERSAGFLALGLAARRRPVAVVCTSGTAAANLHPAVAEAGYAGVPLIVLTADRPPELRASGANQTIDQNRLYGSAVRFYDELAVAEERPGQQSYWRGQVCRARQAALGGGRSSGPAHLNLPFREPLVPDVTDSSWCESLAGRPDGGPWTTFDEPDVGATELAGVRSAQGLVLLAEDAAPEAVTWAERTNWPVLAENGGVGHQSANLVPTGMWLLKLPGFLAEHRPEQVVCVGRPTVFRQVRGLLADGGSEVMMVHPDPVRWPAPGHDVVRVAQELGKADAVGDQEWLAAWRDADRRASAALHAELDASPDLTGPLVARAVVDALPRRSLLVVGSSNPVRDVALAARPRPDVRVHRNRGAAGIDGTVSTAVGAALAHDGPAYALLGDLTFLHDANGLLLGPHEPRPDLTIVVCNDDGGAIFGLLEQGDEDHAESFERIFGTPHGTDLSALCAAHGVTHELVRSAEELPAALAFRPGLRVVEVRAERGDLRGLHERLSRSVEAGVLGERP